MQTGWLVRLSRILGLNRELSKKVYVFLLFFHIHICDIKFMCRGRDHYEAHRWFLYFYVKHPLCIYIYVCMCVWMFELYKHLYSQESTPYHFRILLLRKPFGQSPTVRKCTWNSAAEAWMQGWLGYELWHIVRCGLGTMLLHFVVFFEICFGEFAWDRYWHLMSLYVVHISSIYYVCTLHSMNVYILKNHHILDDLNNFECETRVGRLTTKYQSVCSSEDVRSLWWL